jgi:hypothetical protein
VKEKGGEVEPSARQGLKMGRRPLSSPAGLTGEETSIAPVAVFMRLGEKQPTG